MFQDVMDDDEDYGYQIKTEQLGKNFYAKLTVKKAQYYHTGAYYCRYNVDDDPNADASSMIYVYAFGKQRSGGIV